MSISKSPAAAGRSTDLDLDVSFAPAGMTVGRVGSEDCTGDGCGGTNDSAGTTC